ncbi:uncharacterized protein LOC133321339 [Musca vetustissima]|uniref:uncharacterized protein LOC133321339 n=1 Tax=Musca vetustissima TaxID=27455 RepID=UPI002AB72D02|nr:uncharacterized protein LOC133321339 [Musca vetustissima]
MANKKEIEILMVGLDNAGKTRLHYTLKEGPMVNLITTLGYNVETIEYKGQQYTIYEIGGLNTVRILRNFYTENKSIVIYVVDVADKERYAEAQEDLHNVFETNENLSDAILLVLGNKIDLLPAFDVNCLVDILKLPDLKQKWKLLGISTLMDGRDELCKIFDVILEMLPSENCHVDAE